MNQAVKKLLMRSPLAALLVVLAAAAPAAAESVVPPENSAANQYTESYPTGGGGRNAYAEGDDISPGAVIGKRNAEKLDKHGEEGRAVAELAAETTPVLPSEATDTETEDSGQAGGGGGNGGNGSGNGKTQPVDQTPADAGNQSAQTTSVSFDSSAEGSSGLGEILGQAFGTSSGGMGLLLPLMLIAIAIWAFAIASRQRRRPAD